MRLFLSSETYLRLRLHDICSWISSVPFRRPRCP
ncbi:hypothetical protein Tco_0665696, partial [Tanacetum coccineum]